MDYNFETWQKALEDFQQNVTKELEEIRQYKEAIRMIKESMDGTVSNGYFLRDDHRLILSAPEIVIGDVDRDGILHEGSGSIVILRGRQVNLEGVGAGGQVLTRAGSIRQMGVDPGVDGNEAVVGDVSEVVSQAETIVLEGNETAGVFTQAPSGAGSGGVRIHADGNLVLEASNSSERQKENLEALVKKLEEEKKTIEGQVKASIKASKDLSKSLSSIMDSQEDDLQDEMIVRTDFEEMAENAEKFAVISHSFYDNFDSCAKLLSRLAELNRQIACAKAEKDSLPKADSFKKETTGASISLVGERVNILSEDGDGNIRDNKGAGVGIVAHEFTVQSQDAKNALQKDGKVLLRAQTVEIATTNVKDEKFDDNGKQTAGEYPAEGDVIVKSKTFTLESVDREFKDNKEQEKALTKDSSLSIRTETVDVSATDTEGKATGSIALNAKEIAARSMNVKKDNRKDDKLAEGSTMLLLAEKMYVGSKTKDIKSQKVQIVTGEAGFFADKTLELQQGNSDSALQLSGGNAAVGGSKVEVFGATTITGKAEVKDELKAPKATIDHLEAKSSFKSSNISDGIAIPGAPANGKLSAKLKVEDAPEKQEKK